MRMMDELKPLFLYSSNKKVYAPIDEKDRRHNAAILLLTPSLEVSSKLINLPYLHNPNLFTSFYIDRNVMAYIDNTDIDKIEFDEKEEEAVSEAMLRNWNSKVKFKFDENISIMDKRYVEEVFNQALVKDIVRILKLTYTPEKIKIFIHPNVSSLRKDAPSGIQNIYDDKLYSYSNGEEIHIVSKTVYDPEMMGGTYPTYLKNELICNLVLQANPDLAIIPVLAISQVFSGVTDYRNNNKDSEIGIDACNKFAKIVSTIKSKNKIDIVHKYLKTGDINLFARFSAYNTINSVRKLIFEAELSYFERQRLLPSEFGIPDKRKYPMPNEEHVRLAIKMFNHCDPSDEEELAKSIIKKIKQFGVTDIKVSAANKFRPYWEEELRKQKMDKDKKKDDKDKKKDDKGEKKKFRFNLFESFVDSDYEDILKICSHLSDNELKRITFYDTYRNSQFVIKRIIKRIGGEPAGFLDVYQFPSKPEIAQIVIAVAEQFRGQGISDEMVKELLNSDLHWTHNFSTYYWTAHPYNEASKNLALKNGFKDMNYMDDYGRMVFTKRVKNAVALTTSDLPDSIKPTSGNDATITENAFVTEDMALISEADNSDYSQKLKKYLYRERIRNNKETIDLYERVKQMNPSIKRTYIKLEMYKRLNIFVDLSYYHALFLKNNIYKLDKAVHFYFDFLNKLINNKEINTEYRKQTVFIPIDSGVWPVAPNSELSDYRKNLNPISIIFRLIRTDPNALKKAWGNKRIVFVGSRGYFTVDFKNFDMKALNRFRINLRKLMSTDEPIEDDYEIDDIKDDDPEAEINTAKKANTTKALTAKMIDKVERGTSIKVDNISGSTNPEPVENSLHLQISKDAISVGEDKDSVAIISIDPDGPDGYERLSKTILSNVGKVSTYCMPK